MQTTITLRSPIACSSRGAAWLRLTLIGGFWLAAVLSGVVAMLRYEFSPGGDPNAPAQWPAASGIPGVAGRPTLVVFAHPRCPCTGATLDELAEVMAAAGPGSKASVLYFTPAGAGPEWRQAPALRQAASIPGVTVVADEDGREARLFHATTSGRTLLYRADGELLFDGGITGSRGHAGENAGATALIALLTSQSDARAQTPVFGCSILPHRTTTDAISCQR